MKITLAIPTNVDWPRLDHFKQSLVNNTADPRNVDVVFVDNCNTFGHDILPWVDKLREQYRGTIAALSMPERKGLTTAWKRCTQLSDTEWTVIVNDDVYCMPAWDTMFIDLVKKEPDHGMFLLCKPYNWSGFAVNKDFITEFPWRTEFPEGYHEDNDLYLRVAQTRGFTTKYEVYTKGIYCLPYVKGSYCFQHLHHTETQKSKYYTRWDDKANEKVFNRYWLEVNKDHPQAIENKNGKYYIPAPF